jgi:hypothetical protein
MRWYFIGAPRYVDEKSFPFHQNMCVAASVCQKIGGDPRAAEE